MARRADQRPGLVSSRASGGAAAPPALAAAAPTPGVTEEAIAESVA